MRQLGRAGFVAGGIFLLTLLQLLKMASVSDQGHQPYTTPNLNEAQLQYGKQTRKRGVELKVEKALSLSRHTTSLWGDYHKGGTGGTLPYPVTENRSFTMYTGSKRVQFPKIEPPQSYSGQFKNPCWYATPEDYPDLRKSETFNNNLLARRMISPKQSGLRRALDDKWANSKYPSLKCLPYFFIVGMEKCGTTDMFARLTLHPKIVKTPMKEIQWWTRRRLIPMKDGKLYLKFMSDEKKLAHKDYLIQVPLLDYASFFDLQTQEIDADQNIHGYRDRILVDASANSFYWNDFAEMFSEISEDGPTEVVADDIRRAIPQARILISLRDPVSRLYSNYVFFNKPTHLSSAVFHRKAELAIISAKRCFAEYGYRSCAYSVDLKGQMDPTVNVLSGMYIIFLKDWIKAFGRKQVHVTHFETYRNDTRGELSYILTDFLDVRDTSGTVWETMMRNKPALQSGSRYEHAGKMLKRTEAMLEDFYRPFNKALAEYLGDQRFAWEQPSSHG